MEKYKTILVILGIVIAILGTFLLVMFTGLSYNLPGLLTNSYCASLGVIRISDHELNIIQNYNVSEPIKFLEITEEDLKTVPKLKEAINKIGDRVEFNDYSRAILPLSEMNATYKFLSDKFEQQNGFEMEPKSFFHLNYNDKIYLIDGFVFTNTPYDIELMARLDPSTRDVVVKITDDDFKTIPSIKKAIDEIGSYETSPFNAVGIPEDEWNRYQTWFKEKYEKQYGAKTDGSYTTYFHYNGKNYDVSFGIC